MRGFWRGMIAGGLIGGMLNNLLGSPLKKVETRALSNQVKGMRAQAEKLMMEAKNGVMGINKKK